MSQEHLDLMLDRLESDATFLGQFVFARNARDFVAKAGMRFDDKESGIVDEIQRRIREAITTTKYVARGKLKEVPAKARERCSPNGASW